eukprot:TRINITY_DN1135_c1_g1_i1.p1 TRINITY_DN1135_c1_g1~~TRINITY_DN1135_c1_g1_i1.p1  ORF type:complete len:481 (+),score=231.06 TRINITY_DN1135_c1_g1_i1:136-1578(+)
MTTLDTAAVAKFVEEQWNSSVISTLEDYIRIPNQSPIFDPNWNTNGLQEKAVELIVNWIQKQNLANSKLEVIKDAARTPVILIEVESTCEDKETTVLLYGHLDKQPPLEASLWLEGTGPYEPKIIDGKLYGRGGADDGYSSFSAVTALLALKRQNIPHARCVILIEASEESGSIDLPFYMQLLAPRLGKISLIICLDSGCGNYDQFWITSSLRGIIVADLKVQITTEGVHSGSAGGIVPSTFRIARSLLNRIENAETGEVTDPIIAGVIPEIRIEQARATAEILGDLIWKEMPFLPNAQPVTKDLTQCLLNKTYRPTVEVTGCEGIPASTIAGNVLRPYTLLRLSIRAPPYIDTNVASQRIKELLEQQPIAYNATVSCNIVKHASGWESPVLSKWLDDSAHKASQTFFSKPHCFIGEGGTIPFMGMLAKEHPTAQFIVTGVLGPQSNAHGPNEFLHIDVSKKVTCCVASILADHSKHMSA